ncbi:uncharacterized protein LOC123306475 [Coccinella septempunctata]|uniref:uncharacterized protein LOC123306475 n=1 Tax=Coccinella septempunctata TaxID=41139 RepID=UPI001D096C11|nr:uncharacterized protein LOC123306475 [Coccinella septempunctata]
MADKPPSRPMKYPYTTAAQIAQFPLKFHVKNQWIWKYYFVSLVVCFPVFYKINSLVNSPGNVEKWEAAKKKEREEAAHGHH